MTTFINLKNTLTREIPAFCVYGNDRWLKLKAVANICAAYNVQQDFGVDRLDSPTYKQIAESCCTPTLFGEKKLVLCENFVFPQGRQSAETCESLTKLIGSCDGSFCLVFVADSLVGFDKIKNLEAVCCDKLDIGTIVKWIVAFAKKQGVSVDATCARKIADYCLQDMSRVETETQKLIDYGEVTVEAVDALVHKDTEYVVFNLSKTICDKNANAAIQLYKGLIASGEEARGLFGLLYNFYRRAYYAKTSDAPTESLAQLLGVKPFAVERAKEIATRYKPMQLKRILDCFDKADVLLKAFLDENEVMTTLILQIVSI